MCGLAGFVRFGRQADVLKAVARDMANSLIHRGPDDTGVWDDVNAGFALAHNRLAIVDLSSAGHQPMLSTCGRFVIAFNGEIYNHLALREDLRGSTWRGHSDTETLLAAIAAWGVAVTLKRCVGMFAFALWDRKNRALTLARDRLGEKPMYYGWQNCVFMFGSELKALQAHPSFQAEVDRNVLAMYLRFGYVPSPYSIYQDIRKLPPGTWLTLSADDSPECMSKPQAYWRVEDAALASPRYDLDKREAADELDGLLRRAVAGQMLADVPLGAFLSGGLDSSMVVALMQVQSSRPVKTFSIGFHEPGYDEAVHAQAVARYLGCDHTELYVTSDQALQVIPRLPALYDEPFADSSQIPTFLVAQLARSQVKVSLSGDGGDELFAGYNRYFWAARIWRALGVMPGMVRGGLVHLLRGVPPEKWNRVFAALMFALPARLRYANPGDKLHKLAEILAACSPEEVYLFLVSQWKHPETLVLGSAEPDSVLSEDGPWRGLTDFESRMMYLDQISYLPDDILVKVDRAAMGVSLETRLPLLDHRVVEFAWQLPMAMKIRNGMSKWLLRQVLYRYVPKGLIERPKMGFGIPVGAWLRGPLKDWAEALLNESRLRHEGYFNHMPLRDSWREHLSGQRNWGYRLWAVLVFQSWLESIART